MQRRRVGACEVLLIFNVRVTLLMVAPTGTTDRSKAIKARRANLALVFPVNMLVPIPLLLSPALVSYSVLSLLEPIIIDWAELEGTAVGGIAVGCTEVGGAGVGGVGVGSVGCPSVTVIVAVMKGYMEQKKANSRASRNVNSKVCPLFSVPLSQMSVLSAGTPEVVVCGRCPDSPRLWLCQQLQKDFPAWSPVSENSRNSRLRESASVWAAQAWVALA